MQGHFPSRIAARHRFILATVFVATSIALPARADYLVETDPSTFVLGGFAAHVRIAPAATPRWLFGVGAYALDFPSFMVNLAPANRDEGWSVRLRLGYGVFVDRYLTDSTEGPFIGIQVAAHHLGASRSDERNRFVNGLVMPRVGYTWRPFESGFYVLGWFGAGFTRTLAGSAGDYDVFPLLAFGAVHVGWRFP